MPERFQLFRDYTAELGTEPDPDLLICVHPSADPAAWPFEIKASAVALFEAMPVEFTFDELVQIGEQHGHSAERVVEHLRAYECYEMVEHRHKGTIRKTGRKPYF